MKTKRIRVAHKVVLGAALSVSTLGAVALAMPTAAGAQENCTYNSGGELISCSNIITSSTSAPTSTAVSPSVSASSSSLPLTGADVEQLAAIGGGAILIGGVLVLRSRRRANAAATGSGDGLVLADRTVWSQWRSGSPSTRG